MVVPILLTLLLAIFIGSALLYHLHARATSSAAYNAVVALGDVAKAAHELTELEFRTAVSMEDTFYGVKNFAQESNPTMRRAKMRGYEVYRNERIGPAQSKLNAAYKRYEHWTRVLIEIATLHPYVWAWHEFSERGAQWRERRRRRNTDDHPNVEYSHDYIEADARLAEKTLRFGERYSSDPTNLLKDAPILDPGAFRALPAPPESDDEGDKA